MKTQDETITQLLSELHAMQDAWTRREKVWAECLHNEIIQRKAAEAALDAFLTGTMLVVDQTKET